MDDSGKKVVGIGAGIAATLGGAARYADDVVHVGSAAGRLNNAGHVVGAADDVARFGGRAGMADDVARGERIFVTEGGVSRELTVGDDGLLHAGSGEDSIVRARPNRPIAKQPPANRKELLDNASDGLDAAEIVVDIADEDDAAPQPSARSRCEDGSQATCTDRKAQPVPPPQPGKRAPNR